MPRPPSLRVAAVLVVAAAAVSLGGCGGAQQENPVRRALGPMSDKDWTGVRALLRHAKGVPKVDVRIVRALNAEDLTGAKAATAELGPLVRDGLRRSQSFEGPRLRAYWLRYFRGLDAVQRAYGAVFALAARPGVSDAEVDGVVCPLVLAKRRVQAQDADLARRVVRASPPGDREDARRELRRKQAEYERSAGSKAQRTGCPGDQGAPALP